MHSDGSAGYPVQLRPLFRRVRRRRFLVLDEIDLATDYQIVLHLLLPEVEVRPIELPKAHFG